MNADASRTLARFISSLNLDRAVARELAAQFADVEDVADLPDWVREVGDPEDVDDPTLDEIQAMADEGKQARESLSALDVLRLVEAAGHDVTPGHDELHHFWTRDPRGLARWIDSPTPWRTLVALLSEHVPVEKAKRFASAWLHEVTGNWPGSDAHRVATGHAPRGSRVGPG